MEKPKVAILAPLLVPRHPAGSQMLKVVSGLAEKYDFTVFGQEIDDSLRNKVAFRKISIPVFRPLLIRYMIQFWIYGNLFRQIQMNKHFAIVHSVEASAPFATVITMHFCGAAASALARKEMRQGMYRQILYRFGSIIEQKAVTNPYLQRLIVVSDGLKRDIIDHYRPLVHPQVIPNSVDVDRFANARMYRRRAREELEIKQQEVIGVIAALGDWKRKGLDVLIDAISILPQNSVRILVAGGFVQAYKDLCQRKGVSQSFIFLDFMKNIEKAFAAADFFVFPTVYEAWPLTGLEAAAAGLPLLATKVNGLEEFIENGVNGFFIERSPDSIARAISTIHSNPELRARMGTEAHRKAQLFRVERMIDSYRHLYEELIQ